jgi:hypothetical protein
MSDFLIAVVELGLPIAALSWLLFNRLYSRGDLARDADRKAIRAGLKQIKSETKKSQAPADSILHAKWMRFGGGFYGVAALWTLIVIETGGLAAFVAHPSSLEAMFKDGVIGFLVNLVVNQFTGFLQALLWFNWWSARGHNSVTWIAVAWFAYLGGLNLARRETALGSQLVGFDWRAQLRSRLGGSRDDERAAADRDPPAARLERDARHPASTEDDQRDDPK